MIGDEVRGRGIKKGNSYAAVMGSDYDLIPKAVFAAIAVSRVSLGGDRLDVAKDRIMEEWRILYENRIVPQKPIRYVPGVEPEKE